jgi:ssDNA-specific exonuclease RecJ
MSEKQKTRKVKSPEERIAELEAKEAELQEKKKALQAQKQKILAQENAKRRKLETTIKIILGACALKVIADKPESLDRLLEHASSKDKERVREFFNS